MKSSMQPRFTISVCSFRFTRFLSFIIRWQVGTASDYPRFTHKIAKMYRSNNALMIGFISFPVCRFLRSRKSNRTTFGWSIIGSELVQLSGEMELRFARIDSIRSVRHGTACEVDSDRRIWRMTMLYFAKYVQPYSLVWKGMYVWLCVAYLTVSETCKFTTYVLCYPR